LSYSGVTARGIVILFFPYQTCMINNTAFNSMKLKIINRQILKMLDSGGGALQAIVYIKNNTTLIKNVLLRKR